MDNLVPFKGKPKKTANKRPQKTMSNTDLAKEMEVAINPKSVVLYPVDDSGMSLDYTIGSLSPLHFATVLNLECDPNTGEGAMTRVVTNCDRPKLEGPYNLQLVIGICKKSEDLYWSIIYGIKELDAILFMDAKEDLVYETVPFTFQSRTPFFPRQGDMPGDKS